MNRIVKQDNKKLRSEKQEIGPPTTVLAVEDDEGLNHLIQMNLQREGFRTEGAFNGSDAIAKIVEAPNSLLLLDYLLPDMTGRTVIETLSERKYNVPFIIMTGCGNKNIAVEMMKLGARDYIVKGSGFVDLLPQVVKRVCVELDKERRLARSEEALRRSYDDLARAQQIAHIGNWEWNIETDKMMWSHEMYRIFDVGPEKLGGILTFESILLKRIHPDDVGLVRDITRRQVEEQRALPLEYRVILPNGAVRVVDSRAELICDEVGKPIGMIGTVQDITEQKQTEQELRKLYTELKESQVQLLQLEKLRTMGMMAAGVAHELNNPLMGIINFVQYCCKHTSKDDRRYPILQDIKQAANRCVDMVQNLLTFAHMEKGSNKEYKKKESCSAILGRVLRLLAYRIEKDNVLVTYHCAKRVPKIPMRVSEIQQVYLNILSNALDALKGAKKKEIDIDVHRENEFIQTTIADNGCGILPENIEKIFHPFFTTKPVGQGTGIGLSTSLSIIEGHGGTITCQSEPGVGARFKISLPAPPKELSSLRSLTYP